MLHRLCFATLLSLFALASPAHARVLWQDTVWAGGREGQANAVVTDGARVYVGGFVGTVDSEAGLVRSYTATSGSLVWEDRPTLPAPGLYEIEKLALDDGRLFATAFAGGQWLVRAYGAAGGDLLWQDARGDDPHGGTPDLAAASGRLFVVGTGSAGVAGTALVVRSHDGATGEVLWEQSPGVAGWDASCAVAVAGGRVFAAGPVDGVVQLVAYAQDDGRALWTAGGATDPFAGSVAALAVAGGRVLIVINFRSALRIDVHDAATGALLWQQHEPPEPLPFPIEEVGLAADGDVAVAGYALGTQRLVAWDARSGAPRWRKDDAGVSRSLHIADGRVFAVRGASALLARAFALGSGVPTWSSPLDADGSALALARSGPLVFVAGVAGPGFGTFHVAAFEARNRVIQNVVPRGTQLPVER